MAFEVQQLPVEINREIAPGLRALAGDRRRS
jgi:hypothetical protein